jgi:hypothetical protein
MRRLPRGSHLKCFTALVSQTRRRSMPGRDERLVEQAARRPDERMASTIFDVSRLLADEQQVGVPRPFSEHRLRRAPPELAAAASRRRRPEPREVARRGT